MKKVNKFYVIGGMIISLGLFYGIPSYADESNQATTMTFSAPVELPGHVLPAGTYLFKLADSDSDRNVVEIFNSDGTKLYATLPTNPTERLEPDGDPTITLAEQGTDTPEAILKWFYPGALTGHEFMYPRHEERQLAHDQQQTIAVNAKGTKADVQAGE